MWLPLGVDHLVVVADTHGDQEGHRPGGHEGEDRSDPGDPADGRPGEGAQEEAVAEVPEG